MKHPLAILVLLLAPFVAAAQDQVPAPAPPSEVQAKPDPWASYPAREVDRPVLTAADGYMMSIISRSFSAQEGFDQNSRRANLVKPIAVFNLDFNLRYGIVDRWEVFAGLPYATAQTSEFSSGAIGNVYLGTRVGLIANDRFQLAAGVQVSLPTGDSEYHYHLLNGEVIPENFRTGNPGVDLQPEVEARYLAASNLSLRLRALGIFTGPGKTVLNQIGGQDFKKSINPGDGWRLDVAAVFQASPRWVIPVGLDYYQVSATELTGFDFNDAQRLLEARAGLMFQFSPAFEVELTAGLPLTGQNTYLATPIGLELRTRF